MSVKHNVVHSWQMLNSADSSLREQLWFWIKYLTNKFGTFITLMSRSECLQTYSLQCLQYNDVMILTHSRLPASVQASELLSVISVPLTPCWDWSSDPDITRVTLSLSPLSLSFPCVSSLHLLFSFLKGLSGFMKAVYEKNKERQRGKTRQYQTYPPWMMQPPSGPIVMNMSPSLMSNCTAWGWRGLSYLHSFIVNQIQQPRKYGAQCTQINKSWFHCFFLLWNAKR